MPRPFAEPFTGPFGEGTGWQEVINLKNPGPTAELVYTVEGQYIVRPKAISFQLAASITAGTRFPSVRHQTQNGEMMAVSVISAGIGQSTTGTVAMWIGANTVAPAGFGIQIAPLADLWLSAGESLRTVTVGLGANDQYSKIVITVDRFYSDAVRHPNPRARRGAGRRML